MKITTWLAIGLLACAMVLVDDDSATSAERSPTPVRVQAVESYVAGGGVRYSASINPYTQVDLAFKVGGYIQEILQVQGADDRMRDVQGGDWVNKGTILARVRQRDYVEKVNQAKAQLATAQASGEQARVQLAKAKAALEKAKLDFERATNLLATQSMTKADYDAAKANLEVAQAG